MAEQNKLYTMEGNTFVSQDVKVDFETVKKIVYPEDHRIDFYLPDGKVLSITFKSIMAAKYCYTMLDQEFRAYKDRIKREEKRAAEVEKENDNRFSIQLRCIQCGKDLRIIKTGGKYSDFRLYVKPHTCGEQHV